MTTDPVRVEVVYAMPGQHWSVRLQLAPGSTARQAWQQALATGAMPPDAQREDLGLAIYGRAIPETAVLRDGDRLELLRPLQADPKQGRRDRADSKPGRGRNA